jgi:hypothetical protein
VERTGMCGYVRVLDAREAAARRDGIYLRRIFCKGTWFVCSRTKAPHRRQLRKAVVAMRRASILGRG